MDYQKILNSINKQRCTKHKLRPIIVSNGEDFTFVCCCENFKRELSKKHESSKMQITRENIIEDYVFLTNRA